MKKIPVEKIEEGMILGREVCGPGGNVLLSKGITLSRAIGRRLQNWSVSAVYIEGEEERHPEEETASASPEELRTHLTAKFSKTLRNSLMKKIFDAVYSYRLQKNL